MLTLWTYLTPIMYDLSAVGNTALIALMKCNPLYQYIDFARTIILFHATPRPLQFLLCGVSSAAVLIVGAAVFRARQDRFIYYV